MAASVDLLSARRYAQAIFELANELGVDEQVEAELESFSAALRSDPQLEKFLANPALRPADKESLLKKVYGERDPKIYGHLLRFFLVLFKKNRFYLVHDVASEFRRIADESQGQAIAEIRSASPLSSGQRDAIVSRMERISGKKMVVRAETDPSLLGGVWVKVGNKVIDDTVRTKISNFKKELTKAQSI